MSETNKYYCIKSDKGWLTKGNVYEFNGTFTFDNGVIEKDFATWEAFEKANRGFAPYLIPLVQRPAKVGDKIRINNTGEICEVIALHDNNYGIYVRTTNQTLCAGSRSDREIEQPFAYLFHSEYLVLDYSNQPTGEQTMTLQQQLEAAKAERDEKDKQIAEIEMQIEEARKPWKPKYGRVCYMANPLSENNCDSIIWENSSTDNRLYAAGLITRTTPEAIEAGKRMYYRAWAESLSDVTEEMWENGDAKYYMVWDGFSDKLKICFSYQLRSSGVYFTSESALQSAIDIIGKDLWIKYVLGVNI